MNQQCNVENMTKWIEALESGEYPQDPGGGRLKTDAGYCCLGVLCELDGETWTKLPGGGLGTYQTYDGFSAYPSNARMKRFLGFSGPVLQDAFADVDVLNDRGHSFIDIAARLRKEFNLPKAEPAGFPDGYLDSLSKEPPGFA
jgi:hypothetical protein